MPNHRLRKSAGRGRGRFLTALGATVAVGTSLLVAAPHASAATTQQIVRPSNDAYTSAAASSTVYNTGRLTASSTPGAEQVIYLTFTAPSLPTDASGTRMRIVLNRDLHHLSGIIELHAVANSGWSEQSLTANNAPAVGAKLGSFTASADTARVSFTLGAPLAAGPVSFAVTALTTTDVARFRSDEYGADGPRLVVNYQRDGVPPPPAGDLSEVWIGASASKPAPDGTTDYSIGTFNTANAAIGPLTFRRSFDSTLPASFQKSAARDDAANGYRSFVSWKPPNGDFVGAANGTYDAAVTAWARSVPNTGVYATAFHEPENDMTGPQFVAMQRHLYTVVKAANPSIQWGSVYMAYWWDDGTSHYVGDKDSWWPGADYADFTAVDVYSNDPRPLETHPEFRGWYDYMLGKGVPMLIAEYGQYVVKPGTSVDQGKINDRVATIQADAAWLAQQGTISMWLYWDATGSQGDWQLNDPLSQAAWRDIAQSGRST